MAIARLDPQELVVTSFPTSAEPATPVSPATTQLSQEAGCMSPLCMPTFWKTCDPNTV